MKPHTYYVLRDCWHGVMIDVHWCREPGGPTEWHEVSHKDYLELRRQGYRVRRDDTEMTRKVCGDE